MMTSVCWVVSWTASLQGISVSETIESDAPPVIEKRVTIELPELVRIQNSTIQLGDVATLTEGVRGDRVRLLRVNLGHAPKKDGAKTLSRSGLRSWLIEQGFSPDSFEVIGAGTCRIELETVTITADEILMRAQAFLEENLANGEDRLLIQSRSRPEGVSIPSGIESPTISIHPVGQLKGKRVVHVEARVMADGLRLETVPIAFNVQHLARVFVTTVPVRAGESFQLRYLEIREVDLSSVRGTPVRPDISLAQYRTKRSMGEGAVLTEEMIELPPLVERNERVSMVMNKGRLVVRVEGVARQAGRLGDSISVLNLSSKRVVTGVVTDAGVVEVGKR